MFSFPGTQMSAVFFSLYGMMFVYCIYLGHRESGEVPSSNSQQHVLRAQVRVQQLPDPPLRGPVRRQLHVHAHAPAQPEAVGVSLRGVPVPRVWQRQRHAARHAVGLVRRRSGAGPGRRRVWRRLLATRERRRGNALFDTVPTHNYT